MALHKLVFDATSADTIAASAQVGAVLYDAVSGNLGEIKTNGTSSDNELLVKDTDVLAKLNSGVVVTATDLDIRDLTHVSDSIKIGDGTDFLAVNGDGSINAVVSATDLDIRNLTFATDKVDASGSTLGANDGVDIGDVTINNAAGASAVNIQDGGNSITVDAADLDIRDLLHTQDSIRLGDGTSLITSTLEGGKQALDVYVANSIDVDDGLANTAIDAGAETIGTAQSEIMATPLASRKYAFLYNNGNREMFIGQTGVLASTGFPLPPGSMLELRIGDAVDIFAIADAAGQDLRTMELS